VSLFGLFVVGIGAALGACLRWSLSLWLNPIVATLPLGTLAANLIGGYLMGVAMGLLPMLHTLSPEARLMITTGFLGGLTTFSTFSAESTSLLLRQQFGAAMLLIGVHVLGSLAATALGLASVHGLRLWIAR
jgi:fluoride exporter